mmetsp:Transcript_40075/g.124305  ORF Transcript_40075/g.124305 Transcript_40075/m.124305 type:complete len:308 (+) Transcript_40075:311-1234(+)
MEPVTDQASCQAEASSSQRDCLPQGWPAMACVQMTTVPSSAQDAMVLAGMPTLGRQATSRTQSPCSPEGKWCWSAQASVSSSCRQMRTWLSAPPVTSLRGPSTVLRPAGSALSTTAGVTAGTQQTAKTPPSCARKVSVRQPLASGCGSSRRESTVTFPSQHAAASCSPYSQGLKATPMARPCTSWRWIWHHSPSASRQTSTQRSSPTEASTGPKAGCDHATSQTGPSWWSSAMKHRVSTSHTRTQWSAEAVASRLPWWSSCAACKGSRCAVSSGETPWAIPSGPWAAAQVPQGRAVARAPKPSGRRA